MLLICIDFTFFLFSMTQDFLEPAKILFARYDIIYGLIGAVVVIFTPSEYREFWLKAKKSERH